MKLLWNRNKLLFENVTKSADWCKVNCIESKIKNLDNMEQSRFLVMRRHLLRIMALNSDYSKLKIITFKLFFKLFRYL